MVRIFEISFWYYLQQAVLDLQNILSRRNASAVGNSEYVRINGNGRVTEGGIEYDICGFSTHTGQRFKIGTIIWYVTAVFFHQLTASGNDMSCLVIKESDGFYVGK